MFLYLTYICKKYTNHFLPPELEDHFYYLLRKKNIYPKNLLQDIKLLHQDYYDNHLNTLLSILSINLNSISYYKTNIHSLNKGTFFCGVQIINHFRNLECPVYYSNKVKSTSATVFEANPVMKMSKSRDISDISDISDLSDLSISLQEYTYEDFKFSFQYFDSYDYIEKFPDMNEYFDEVQRIKIMIQSFFDILLQEHNLPLKNRKIKGLSVKCSHFKSLYKAHLRII